jgi:hypothetical protein
MNLAITIPLAINAALGVGWVARAAPVEPGRWPLVDAWLDSVNLTFSRRETGCAGEDEQPWTPTLVAIRAENNELNLLVYGSLDAPESWRRAGPPVVYVYPDANITVGDVVAALDRLEELVPANTIVVTELHETRAPRE